MKSEDLLRLTPETPDGTYGATLLVDVHVRGGRVVDVTPRYDYELGIVDGKPGVSGYKLSAKSASSSRRSA